MSHVVACRLRSVYDLTGIMAVVLLLGVLAIITDAGIVLARAWVLRWAPTTGAAGTIP